MGEIDDSKIEAAADVILERVPASVAGVLRRRRCSLSDPGDMGRITSRTLKGRLVYIMFVFKKDGRVRRYVGSATSSSGAGKRLVEEYEYMLQLYEEGIFHSGLTGNFPEEAAKEDTDRIEVRYLYSEDLPPHGGRAWAEFEARLLFIEGIGCDLLHVEVYACDLLQSYASAHRVLQNHAQGGTTAAVSLLKTVLSAVTRALGVSIVSVHSRMMFFDSSIDIHVQRQVSPSSIKRNTSRW